MKRNIFKHKFANVKQKYRKDAKYNETGTFMVADYFEIQASTGDKPSAFQIRASFIPRTPLESLAFY